MTPGEQILVALGVILGLVILLIVISVLAIWGLEVASKQIDDGFDYYFGDDDDGDDLGSRP